jgi:hypothetical protein
MRKNDKIFFICSGIDIVSRGYETHMKQLFNLFLKMFCNLVFIYIDIWYYKTEQEIERLLLLNPITCDNLSEIHSMLYRLSQNKKYIPFYMKEEDISFDFNINIDDIIEYKNNFAITPEGILMLMGINLKSKLKIIISSQILSDLKHLDIVEQNRTKYNKFGAHGHDDIIENYTITIKGYKFIEPRFYEGDKAKIMQFIKDEKHIGYPFNQITKKQWGIE